MTTDYYNHERSEIASVIVGRDLSVLELGCGAGSLGASLKSSGIAARVEAVEAVESAATQAATRLDVVHHGDLDSFDMSILGEGYDCLIAADVLEHLKDPWSVLQAASQRVRPGGAVYVSVPNVQHFRVSFGLLRGRWRYEDFGIMDRTHLRFFTRETACELFALAGVPLDRVVPVRSTNPIVARLGGFGTVQYILVGHLER